MKKLFILLTTCCLSLGGFAQNKYVDLIVNGNMEGDDMSCFTGKDWASGSEVWGPARLVVDPTDETNHCAVVTSRDIPEDKETIDDWDTQFFITVSDKLEVGDEYKVTFRVRADKAATGQTQAHDQPGGYIHWAMIGDVNFTTEWVEITRTGTITADQAPEDRELHTIAFNLAVLKEANSYYFDDVKVEVKKFTPPDYSEFDDLITNGDFEGDDVSNFTSKDWASGSEVWGPARLIIDPTDESNHCAVVTSRDIPEDKETIDDWDSQFFITVADKLEVGDEYKVTFRVRADKAATGQTQAHDQPGGYIHWAMIGDVNFTTEWVEIIKTGTITADQAPQDRELHTIAFNLAVLKEANNYYFDDIKFEVKKFVPEEDDDDGFDDLITNGNCEGDDVSNFTSKEWESGSEVWGPARLVVDPTDETNHCAIVTSRDIPEDKETIDDWDSQFFITVADKLEVGDEYKVTFRVRADKAATGQTQAHDQPGGYIHWAMIGDVNFTTEWVEITRTGTITADQAPADRELHTIAFNLAVLKEANNYYFDDIKFKVKKAKPVENWFNMVRNGDLSTDLVSNFIGRDGVDGIDRPARIVTLEDGSRAMNVTSVESSINPETGEETITDWQTQFFVTTGHVLKQGEKYKFVMEACAEKPAQIQSQIHKAPGGYLFYQMVGNFDLTPEWQRFEVDGVVSAEQEGGYTIAFNCNVLKEVNNYYFRNIEFNIDKDIVTEQDLIVGREELELTVPGPDEEFITQVNMTNALYYLDTKDFAGLINGEFMKVQGADGLLGANVSAATGTAFNLQGIGDPDGTITLEVTQEDADNKIANFVVNNIGSEDLSEDVSTRVAFEQDGWYYVYNVKFVKASLLGDANGDGVVDVHDVSYTVANVLGKVQEGFVFANADVNFDGIIDINDVMGIVAIIFQ